VRIAGATITDTPPVRLFEVGQLSDVVVLAGPNGVGKTRLVQAIIPYGIPGLFLGEEQREK
jgi:hypothetical protein